jgi:hypothetical protein
MTDSLISFVRSGPADSCRPGWVFGFHFFQNAVVYLLLLLSADRPSV